MEEIGKILSVPITKSLVLNDDGTAMVLGYFTSDNEDEVGDIITREATERAIPKYRIWGNIRLMHQPKPVGRITRIGTADGLEWNEIEILVVDTETIRLIQFGVLKALSVGILVDMADVVRKQDGGFIINDYQLAEISFVDHPANYDAKLKDIQVDQGLRQLIHEHGMVALARSMQTILNRELPMEEQNETLLEEEVVEDAVVEAEVEETDVEETTEELELSLEAEEVVEETPAVEEETIEIEASIDEVEDATEENVRDSTWVEELEDVAVTNELSIPADFFAEIKSLTLAIQELNTKFAALSIALTEAEAEVQEIVEQSDSEVEEEEEVAEDVVEEVEEPEDVRSAPVNRNGAVLETELPSEEEPEAEEKKSRSNLNVALERFLKSQ